MIPLKGGASLNNHEFEPCFAPSLIKLIGCSRRIPGCLGNELSNVVNRKIYSEIGPERTRRGSVTNN